MSVKAQIWRKNPDGSSVGRDADCDLSEKGLAWAMEVACRGTWSATLGDRLGVRIEGDGREGEARIDHIQWLVSENKTKMRVVGVTPLKRPTGP